MSTWIREHFRTFIWPGLECMISGPGQIGQIESDFPKKIPSWYQKLILGAEREEGPFPFQELKMLKSFLRLYPRPDYSVYDDWAGKFEHESPWPPEETWKRVRSAFQSVTSYVDKEDRTLLLAGRDVWVFKVLSERSSTRSIYIPEVSRLVAKDSKALLGIVRKHKLNGKELLLDTGFMGSIPTAFSRVMDNKLEFLMLSQNPIGWIPPNVTKGTKEVLPNQVFPNMAKSRSLALWMEYLPKYFKTGYVDYPYAFGCKTNEGKVVQHLSKRSEFIAAACLTSCIWRGIADWTSVLQWLHRI